MGKWLPSHLDERWKTRQKEIEAQIVAKQKALEAEASREEHDRKMMAEVTNTLFANELQRSRITSCIRSHASGRKNRPKAILISDCSSKL